MSYDCIIIGGGLSGLAAGIRLAHFEKKVCICEQHSRLGGLNSFYRRNGILFETGLHAMTNFAAKKSDKSLPLNKIIRQLRIPYDTFRLREQNFSLIDFPGHRLRFSNCFEELVQSVDQTFPSQTDAFRRLNDYIINYNALDLSAAYCSARKVLNGFIDEPELIDMLFCPLMYYGSAVENDMDFAQFVIMYKSIFLEGFCRPGGEGMISLIEALEKRFVEAGGELKTRCGIDEIISQNGHVAGVVTSKGEQLEAGQVLSSAGYLETMRLCREKPANFASIPAGQLAFMELITVVDPAVLESLGFAIMFFNDSASFDYAKPDSIGHLHSGVVCLPTNFRFKEDDVRPEPMLRVTALTNYDCWPARNTPAYTQAKDTMVKRLIGRSATLLDLPNLADHIQFIDLMTPKTIERFTGHINGAVYGSPDKQKDGRTHLDNLFLCGTDQGFLGIVGSMLSGISIANLHVLSP